jgi:ABC-type glycerol-3-phosphate transport system substrate-binding protein
MYKKLSLLLTLMLILLSVSHLSAQASISLTIAVPAWREDVFEAPDFFQEFENQYPGVKVVLAPSSDNTFFTPAAFNLDEHLEAANDYVNSADVLYVTNDNLSVEATRAGLFLDLAPLAAGDIDLNTTDFLPNVLESFQWDRGLWAIPIALDVQLVIYDPAAFDAAGLPYPNDNWTLDDFANADRVLAETSADGVIIRPGFVSFGSSQLLLRSLLNRGFYDETTLLQQPRLTDPDLEALLRTWQDYYADGLLGGTPVQGSFDFAEMPLLITQQFLLSPFVGAGGSERLGALLPGGTAGLSVTAFAVSGGTQHPELAYELLKFLSSDARTANSFFSASPARRSLIGVDPGSGDIAFSPEYSEEVQALIIQAIENGLPASELRFSTYIQQALDRINSEGLDVLVALQEAEAAAIENLQLAADRRAETVVLVATPVPTPVLGAGDVALNFGITSFITPLPNRERWDAVISDFTATDSQVRQIILDTEFASSLTPLAEKFDCFYLPYNNVSAEDIQTVLSLDPFLDADLNFERRDVVGDILNQVQRENRTWAYPINLQPQVLWYNTTAFGAAGVPAPENGWTTDAFADTLRRLRPDPNDPAPFQPREFGGNYILMLTAAFGGLPIDYRTMPPTYDLTNPATVDAMRQVLDLAKDGYIEYNELATLGGGGFGGGGPMEIPIYNETLNQFSFQRLQFSLENEEQDPYRLTTFPRGTQYTPVTYTIGTAYISASTPHPDACYRWITTIAQHPELFNAMPVRQSQLQNTETNAALGLDLSSFYLSFDALLRGPNVIEFPSSFDGSASPGAFITQLWVNRVMDRYVLQDADLETELADAARYINEYTTCTADIPPFDPNNYATQAEQIDYFRQFTRCAVAIDPELTSVFPEVLLGE